MNKSKDLVFDAVVLAQAKYTKSVNIPAENCHGVGIEVGDKLTLKIVRHEKWGKK